MKYQPLRRSINFSSPWLENERGREINCCPIKQVSILYIALLVLRCTHLLPNDAREMENTSLSCSYYNVIRGKFGRQWTDNSYNVTTNC